MSTFPADIHVEKFPEMQEDVATRTCTCQHASEVLAQNVLYGMTGLVASYPFTCPRAMIEGLLIAATSYAARYGMHDQVREMLTDIDRFDTVKAYAEEYTQKQTTN